MKAVILPTAETADLEPLTSWLPEFLLPVVNKPIVERLIELLARHDVKAILTHWGRIRLPGGIPPMANAGCARESAGGVWPYENKTGYASPGTGLSPLPVRFGCPPEITLHRLLQSL